MKVNCLSCGHALDLRDSYEEYDGQIRCFVCGALLAIRTREGQVKWVELVSVALSGEENALHKT
jgi:DNA-directed RNA polymerase subunit N (RpoN/RPB10)